MKSKYYLLYILLSGLTGCSTLIDPDVSQADDTLLTLAKNNKIQLKADGKDRTIVLARLPERAGIVDVSFTTTAGIFVYANNTSIKELADSVSGAYRYARAILQADTLKASESTKQVFVTAEVSNTRNRLMLTFVK